jgi:transcriptional regulator with XRE-family HTH domain
MLSQLKLVRLQKGLKAKQIAERLGVSPAYISMLENGSAVLTPEILFRLAKIYGVTVAELL